MSRIVMYVLNDCRTDVRVLREAATLAGVGHEVTIIARPTDLAATERETEYRDGFSIVRVPITTSRTGQFILTALRSPRAALARLGTRLRDDFKYPGSGWLEGSALLVVVMIGLPIAIPLAVALIVWRQIASRSRAAAAQGRALGLAARWRLSYLSWAEAAALAGGHADVYHGHDLRGLAAAIRARARYGGTLVYDSHEYFTETGGMASQARWIKRLIGTMERRWGSRADAVVTVNQTLAALLARRLKVSRVVVVRNAPPLRVPLADPPDRLRAALGLPVGTPVVLYHGGFLADRGLPQAIAAFAQPGLELAHLVLLGWGEEEARLRVLGEGPAVTGRIHLLPAVPPEELLDWVATADVAIMVNQPRTLNERLSTPNKLFESLAAGVPVVSSDFPERRRIVADDPDGPLGALCDPTDPVAIASAIRSILELEPAAATDLRARCARAARERYTWEAQLPILLEAYRTASGRSW